MTQDGAVHIKILKGASQLASRDLAPGEYTIGGEGADIIVNDPLIAPLHAKITVTHHEIFAGSVQGAEVSVNRRAVSESTRIFPTQKLRLGGDISVEFERHPYSSDPEKSWTPQAACVERLFPEHFARRHVYEVEDLIAEGGMGAILRARALHLKRQVAMKVSLRSGNQDSLSRFVREARINGLLEHPNIVPIYELGVNEELQPYYTMKLVRGHTLREVLSGLTKNDPVMLAKFPLTELLAVFQKVCDAIAFAHSKGVIHRDLKPDNIMTGEYGEVLVMDWGLAKFALDQEPPLHGDGTTHQEAKTIDGSCVGTPQFMSPEQARGENADVRSDIYSLGALLHSILYLSPPVSGKDTDDILRKVGAGKLDDIPGNPKRPHLSAGRVPESLAAVAAKAMAFAPTERYQSVGALQKDITAFQSGFATDAENAGIWKTIGLALRRHSTEATIIIAALAIIVVGTIYAFIRVNGERARSESALEEMRKMAPSIAAEGRTLAAKEKFAEAIEKFDDALRLTPSDARILLAKADVLQSMFRFEEAAHVYRAAASIEPGGRAVSSALLSEEICSATPKGTRPPRELLAKLLERMRFEHRQAAEILPVARVLGEDHKLVFEVWKERLKDFQLPPNRTIEECLVTYPDGLLGLNLRGSAISDLSILESMPLAGLDLSGCRNVRDLAPLRSLPLRSLVIDDTDVSELGPIAGTRLESLSFSRTAVVDLSPLSSIPLKNAVCSGIPATDFAPLSISRIESLDLSATKVRDLSFLARLPLRMLDLSDCEDLQKLGTLAGISTLQTLILPEDFHSLPGPELTAIRDLRKLTSLRKLSAGRAQAPGPAEAFWAAWERDLGWLSVLQRATIPPEVKRESDGRWNVTIKDTALSDISCLADANLRALSLFGTQVTDLWPISGKPIEALDIRKSAVTDLSPLKGMPVRQLLLWETKITDFTPVASLEELEFFDASATALADLSVLRSRKLKGLRIGNTKVTDLTPLEGLPLEILHADSVAVTDLRPLAKCKNLRWCIPPNNGADVTPLRALTNLERLSYSWGEESQPSMTAAEFWQSLQTKEKQEGN